MEPNNCISPGKHESAEGQRSVPAPLLALPPVASGFAACIGIFVLIGWSLDLEPLKRVLPGFVAMNPATAALFILTGVALASALRSRSLVTGVMGKVLSAIVMLAAASELLEFAGISRSPIDEVLFPAKLSEMQDGLPNRMAPNTALNFFLAGLSVLLLDTRAITGYLTSGRGWHLGGNGWSKRGALGENVNANNLRPRCPRGMSQS
jgi:hypothetical protein